MGVDTQKEHLSNSAYSVDQQTAEEEIDGRDGKEDDVTQTLVTAAAVAHAHML